MIYTIYRASKWTHETAEKPCKLAYLSDDKEQWLVDLKSLEDLTRLISEVDKLVMNVGHIVIYDDYME